MLEATKRAIAQATTSAIAALALSLSCAASASADQSDDDYLSQIDAIGLTPARLHVPGPDRQIALGHAICYDLAGGQSPNDMVTAMSRDLPSVSQEDIQFLISAALSSYCGDVLPRPLPWADPCHGGPARVDGQGIYRCLS